MANKQINELTELTTVSGVDLLAIYDLDEGGSEKTKKITKNNFMKYEESDSVTVTAADAASGGNTGTTGTARYTKIGRMIHLKGIIVDIDTTGMTGGNNFYIQGMPYPANATISAHGVVRATFMTFSGNILCSLPGGSSAIYFVETISGGNNTLVSVSDISSGTTDIWFELTYFI